MDVEKPIGAALNRDISRAEVVETDLERFISARHDKRVKAEGRDRAEEEAWIESTRKANALREAELREQWCEYHQEQGRRHRAVLEALASHHEQRAEDFSIVRIAYDEETNNIEAFVRKILETA